MRQLIIFKNNNVELPEPYIDPTQTPLSFLSLQDGSTVSMSHYGTNQTTNKPKLEYSRDGMNWTNWDFTSLTVNNGERIYFRGKNPNGIGYASVSNCSSFTGTGQFSVEGNIMSILYANDYTERFALPDYSLEKVFMKNNSIIYADKLKLPATKLANYCYYYMFYGCSSLVNAPELPATTLAQYCYDGMFYGCSSLVNAPELPATTLADNCYSLMFLGCSSLVIAPELPATKLVGWCYGSMFEGCSSLNKAPELPATTLASYCYSAMFRYCTSLTYVKHHITNWKSLYTNNWLSGVASSGTVECPSASTIPSGSTAGIPTGWTRVDITD